MPDAKKCPKYKFVRFAEPSKRGGPKLHLGGVQRLNPKSKSLLKKVKGKRGVLPAKRKFNSNSAAKGSVVVSQTPQVDSGAAAIAPVLGTGLGLEAQYGMDMGNLSDSSSDDSSSVTDTELIIDS